MFLWTPEAYLQQEREKSKHPWEKFCVIWVSSLNCSEKKQLRMLPCLLIQHSLIWEYLKSIPSYENSSKVSKQVELKGKVIWWQKNWYPCIFFINIHFLTTFWTTQYQDRKEMGNLSFETTNRKLSVDCNVCFVMWARS